jgi:hypothetical protein
MTVATLPCRRCYRSTDYTDLGYSPALRRTFLCGGCEETLAELASSVTPVAQEGWERSGACPRCGFAYRWDGRRCCHCGEGWRQVPLDALRLSPWTALCLDSEMIETVGQLLDYDAELLLKVRYFNEKALHELRTKLAAVGLGLKGD